MSAGHARTCQECIPQGSRRRRLGWAWAAGSLIAFSLAVVVLATSLHVTSLELSQQAGTVSQQVETGCAVTVTGQISTNGATGTLYYRWVFQPQEQAPQPQYQSVVAGQHAADVTVAIQGTRGTSRTVTLQVLRPDRRTASITVVLGCSRTPATGRSTPSPAFAGSGARFRGRARSERPDSQSVIPGRQLAAISAH